MIGNNTRRNKKGEINQLTYNAEDKASNKVFNPDDYKKHDPIGRRGGKKYYGDILGYDVRDNENPKDIDLIVTRPDGSVLYVEVAHRESWDSHKKPEYGSQFPKPLDRTVHVERRKRQYFIDYPDAEYAAIDLNEEKIAIVKGRYILESEIVKVWNKKSKKEEDMFDVPSYRFRVYDLKTPEEGGLLTI